MGILLPHIKYKGLLGSLCNYNSEACWPVVLVQYKHETVTRMGDGVNSLHIYVYIFIIDHHCSRQTTTKDSGIYTPKSTSVCVNERFETYLHDKIKYTCIYS